MKFLKLSLLVMTFTLMPLISFAQEAKDYQAYLIHEDRVNLE